MSNPSTTSHAREDWIIVPDCHEVLVSEEGYQQVQRAIVQRAKPSKVQGDYLLRTLVVCGECGRKMQYVKGKRCPHYTCPTSMTNAESICSQHTRHPEQQLNQLVLDNFLESLRLFVDREMLRRDAAKKVAGTADNLRARLQRIEQEAKQKSHEKVAAYERYADGKLGREDYMALRNSLTQSLQDLEQSRQEIQDQLDALVKAEHSERSSMADAAQQVLQADSVTNQMLLNFIEQVKVYHDGQVEIVYKCRDLFSDSSR